MDGAKPIFNQIESRAPRKTGVTSSLNKIRLRTTKSLTYTRLFRFRTIALELIELIADECGGLEVELFHCFCHLFPLPLDEFFWIIFKRESVEHQELDTLAFKDDPKE